MSRILNTVTHSCTRVSRDTLIVASDINLHNKLRSYIGLIRFVTGRHAIKLVAEQPRRNRADINYRLKEKRDERKGRRRRRELKGEKEKEIKRERERESMSAAADDV